MPKQPLAADEGGQRPQQIVAAAVVEPDDPELIALANHGQFAPVVVEVAPLGGDKLIQPAADAIVNRRVRRRTGSSVEQLITDEIQNSHSYGGCSIFGFE